jgi:hypothetical protein
LPPRCVRLFTYFEARKQWATALDTTRKEEVLIKRRGGEVFSLRGTARTASPFDVPGVQTRATTADILAAVRESRDRD